MDELDRLLAETMHDAAGRAPSAPGLLGGVRDRSRRYHRRRVAMVAGASAVAAVLVVGIPAVTVLTGRANPVAPPAAPAPATSEPVAPSRSPAPSKSAPSGIPRSSSPETETETEKKTGGVKLTNGWTAPKFPYTLPDNEGMSAPVVAAEGGDLSAFFEATEQREHADVTVTVAGRKPAFTSSAVETAKQVRGRAGTLRTVDVQPAKQLTLYWKESADRWIVLATDDTYTPAQVVALADALTSASIAVQPPFDLALSPAGLVTDTVSAARMTFRAPGAGTAGFRTVLRKRQPLTGADRKVGEYDAKLTRHAGSVTLDVDVTDWDATLEVTVDGGLTISDADLVRFAAGVRVLNRSDPE